MIDWVPIDLISSVRKRPGMYLGDTSTERALHAMIAGILQNSIDQYEAGFCDAVYVSLHADGSVSIEDDGPGISVERVREFGLPFLEIAFTTEPKQWTFEVVGGACVNALSERFYVETCRAGKIYSMEFCKGRTSQSLREIGDRLYNQTSGTKVTFLPDESIFNHNREFSWAFLENRLRELAFLNPGIRLTLRDERQKSEREEEFYSGRGITDFMQDLEDYEKLLHRTPLIIRGRQTIMTENGDGTEQVEREMSVEIGLCFTRRRDVVMHCFCNGSRNEGGCHQEGLFQGIFRAITEFAGKSRWLRETPTALSEEDCATGVLAVVSVQHPSPRYQSQCLRELRCSDVLEFVGEQVYLQLYQYFEENPRTARMVFEQVNRATHARFEIEQLRRAKGLV